MCYINSNLVVATRSSGKSTLKTKVFDERGRLLTEWDQCHWLPSTCVMGFEIHGKDHLLVGCRLAR